MRRLFTHWLVNLTICCFVQISFAGAPMVIEITDGIETIPREADDVDQRMSSSFVQNIEAEQIRDTQLDLVQVIENNSGIKIRQLGGIGSQSLVSIRGKSSDQVMVYVDGMLLNNASGGSVDLSHIPASQIARVEIYKDVIPVEFGQAANGGVINIITHRASKYSSADVNAAVGSFDTQKAGFSMTNQLNNWQYVLTGSYIASENDFSFVNENGTFENPDDDKVEKRHNNQLHQHNIVAKAKQNLGNGKTLQYQGELFNKTKHLPTIINKEDNNSLLAYKNQYLNIAYADKSFFSNDVDFKLSARAGVKSTLYDDSEANIGLSKTKIEQRLETVDSKILFKISKERYQLISNSEFRRESLTFQNRFDQAAAKSNRRLTLASALQANTYFYYKKIIVSPAIRYFYSTDKFSGNTETENSDIRDKSYSTLTPQLGMRYEYSQALSLKFNAGQYYRLPNYVELFGTRGYIGANETLKPEKGINLDAGFEFLHHVKSETLTRVNWIFSSFHSIIDDEIVYTFNARGEGKPSNNHRSTISGVENNLTFEFFYETELVSNTTLMMPLNMSDSNDVKLLAGRPVWSQTSKLIWHKEKWQTQFEHVWESEYYYDTEQSLESKRKSIFNVSLTYQHKDVRTNLEVKNIFDHKNKDFYFQVAPGRALFFSMNYRFK